jgi:hypothetical protein
MMTTYEKPLFPQISIQLWAWVFVVTGCTMVCLAHKMGIPTDIGSGIIGTGLGAFTGVLKQLQNVDHANTVNQITSPEKKETL